MRRGEGEEILSIILQRPSPNSLARGAGAVHPSGLAKHPSPQQVLHNGNNSALFARKVVEIPGVFLNHRDPQ